MDDHHGRERTLARRLPQEGLALVAVLGDRRDGFEGSHIFGDRRAGGRRLLLLVVRRRRAGRKDEEAGQQQQHRNGETTRHVFFPRGRVEGAERRIQPPGPPTGAVDPDEAPWRPRSAATPRSARLFKVSPFSFAARTWWHASVDHNYQSARHRLTARFGTQRHRHSVLVSPKPEYTLATTTIVPIKSLHQNEAASLALARQDK